MVWKFCKDSAGIQLRISLDSFETDIAEILLKLSDDWDILFQIRKQIVTV